MTIQRQLTEDTVDSDTSHQWSLHASLSTIWLVSILHCPRAIPAISGHCTPLCHLSGWSFFTVPVPSQPSVVIARLSVHYLTGLHSSLSPRHPSHQWSLHASLSTIWLVILHCPRAIPAISGHCTPLCPLSGWSPFFTVPAPSQPSVVIARLSVHYLAGLHSSLSPRHPSHQCSLHASLSTIWLVSILHCPRAIPAISGHCTPLCPLSGWSFFTVPAPSQPSVVIARLSVHYLAGLHSSLSTRHPSHQWSLHASLSTIWLVSILHCPRAIPAISGHCTPLCPLSSWSFFTVPAPSQPSVVIARLSVHYLAGLHSSLSPRHPSHQWSLHASLSTIWLVSILHCPRAIPAISGHCTPLCPLSGWSPFFTVPTPSQPSVVIARLSVHYLAGHSSLSPRHPSHQWSLHASLSTIWLVSILHCPRAIPAISGHCTPLCHLSGWSFFTVPVPSQPSVVIARLSVHYLTGLHSSLSPRHPSHQWSLHASLLTIWLVILHCPRAIPAISGHCTPLCPLSGWSPFFTVPAPSQPSVVIARLSVHYLAGLHSSLSPRHPSHQCSLHTSLSTIWLVSILHCPRAIPAISGHCTPLCPLSGWSFFTVPAPSQPSVVIARLSVHYLAGLHSSLSTRHPSHQWSLHASLSTIWLVSILHCPRAIPAISGHCTPLCPLSSWSFFTVPAPSQPSVVIARLSVHYLAGLHSSLSPRNPSHQWSLHASLSTIWLVSILHCPRAIPAISGHCTPLCPLSGWSPFFTVPTPSQPSVVIARLSVHYLAGHSSLSPRHPSHQWSLHASLSTIWLVSILHCPRAIPAISGHCTPLCPLSDWSPFFTVPAPSQPSVVIARLSVHYLAGLHSSLSPRHPSHQWSLHNSLSTIWLVILHCPRAIPAISGHCTPLCPLSGWSPFFTVPAPSQPSVPSVVIARLSVHYLTGLHSSLSPRHPSHQWSLHASLSTIWLVILHCPRAIPAISGHCTPLCPLSGWSPFFTVPAPSQPSVVIARLSVHYLAGLHSSLSPRHPSHQCSLHASLSTIWLVSILHCPRAIPAISGHCTPLCPLSGWSFFTVPAPSQPSVVIARLSVHYLAGLHSSLSTRHPSHQWSLHASLSTIWLVSILHCPRAIPAISGHCTPLCPLSSWSFFTVPAPSQPSVVIARLSVHYLAGLHSSLSPRHPSHQWSLHASLLTIWLVSILHCPRAIPAISGHCTPLCPLSGWSPFFTVPTPSQPSVVIARLSVHYLAGHSSLSPRHPSHQWSLHASLSTIWLVSILHCPRAIPAISGHCTPLCHLSGWSFFTVPVPSQPSVVIARLSVHYLTGLHSSLSPRHPSHQWSLHASLSTIWLVILHCPRAIPAISGHCTPLCPLSGWSPFFTVPAPSQPSVVIARLSVHYLAGLHSSLSPRHPSHQCSLHASLSTIWLVSILHCPGAIPAISGHCTPLCPLSGWSFFTVPAPSQPLVVIARLSVHYLAGLHSSLSTRHPSHQWSLHASLSTIWLVSILHCPWAIPAISGHCTPLCPLSSWSFFTVPAPSQPSVVIARLSVHYLAGLHSSLSPRHPSHQWSLHASLSTIWLVSILHCPRAIPAISGHCTPLCPLSGWSPFFTVPTPSQPSVVIARLSVHYLAGHSSLSPRHPSHQWSLHASLSTIWLVSILHCPRAIPAISGHCTPLCHLSGWSFFTVPVPSQPSVVIARLSVHYLTGLHSSLSPRHPSHQWSLHASLSTIWLVILHCPRAIPAISGHCTPLCPLSGWSPFFTVPAPSQPSVVIARLSVHYLAGLHSSLSPRHPSHQCSLHTSLSTIWLVSILHCPRAIPAISGHCTPLCPLSGWSFFTVPAPSQPSVVIARLSVHYLAGLHSSLSTRHPSHQWSLHASLSTIWLVSILHCPRAIPAISGHCTPLCPLSSWSFFTVPAPSQPSVVIARLSVHYLAGLHSSLSPRHPSHQWSLHASLSTIWLVSILHCPRAIPAISGHCTPLCPLSGWSPFFTVPTPSQPSVVIARLSVHYLAGHSSLSPRHPSHQWSLHASLSTIWLVSILHCPRAIPAISGHCTPLCPLSDWSPFFTVPAPSQPSVVIARLSVHYLAGHSSLSPRHPSHQWSLHNSLSTIWLVILHCPRAIPAISGHCTPLCPLSGWSPFFTVPAPSQPSVVIARLSVTYLAAISGHCTPLCPLSGWSFFTVPAPSQPSVVIAHLSVHYLAGLHSSLSPRHPSHQWSLHASLSTIWLVSILHCPRAIPAISVHCTPLCPLSGWSPFFTVPAPSQPSVVIARLSVHYLAGHSSLSPRHPSHQWSLHASLSTIWLVSILHCPRAIPAISGHCTPLCPLSGWSPFFTVPAPSQPSVVIARLSVHYLAGHSSLFPRHPSHQWSLHASLSTIWLVSILHCPRAIPAISGHCTPLCPLSGWSPFFTVPTPSQPSVVIARLSVHYLAGHSSLSPRHPSHQWSLHASLSTIWLVSILHCPRAIPAISGHCTPLCHLSGWSFFTVPVPSQPSVVIARLSVHYLTGLHSSLSPRHPSHQWSLHASLSTICLVFLHCPRAIPAISGHCTPLCPLSGWSPFFTVPAPSQPSVVIARLSVHYLAGLHSSLSPRHPSHQCSLHASLSTIWLVSILHCPRAIPAISGHCTPLCPLSGWSFFTVPAPSQPSVVIARLSVHYLAGLHSSLSTRHPSHQWSLHASLSTIWLVSILHCPRAIPAISGHCTPLCPLSSWSFFTVPAPSQPSVVIARLSVHYLAGLHSSLSPRHPSHQWSLHASLSTIWLVSILHCPRAIPAISGHCTPLCPLSGWSPFFTVPTPSQPSVVIARLSVHYLAGHSSLSPRHPSHQWSLHASLSTIWLVSILHCPRAIPAISGHCTPLCPLSSWSFFTVPAPSQPSVVIARLSVHYLAGLHSSLSPRHPSHQWSLHASLSTIWLVSILHCPRAIPAISGHCTPLCPLSGWSPFFTVPTPSQPSVVIARLSVHYLAGHSSLSPRHPSHQWSLHASLSTIWLVSILHCPRAIPAISGHCTPLCPLSGWSFFTVPVPSQPSVVIARLSVHYLAGLHSSLSPRHPSHQWSLHASLSTIWLVILHCPRAIPAISGHCTPLCPLSGWSPFFTVPAPSQPSVVIARLSVHYLAGHSSLSPCHPSHQWSLHASLSTIWLVSILHCPRAIPAISGHCTPLCPLSGWSPFFTVPALSQPSVVIARLSVHYLTGLHSSLSQRHPSHQWSLHASLSTIWLVSILHCPRAIPAISGHCTPLCTLSGWSPFFTVPAPSQPSVVIARLSVHYLTGLHSSLSPRHPSHQWSLHASLSTI
ncbi:hypothetical protein ACOMHN_031449 [Nucella lapillus]